MIIWVSNEVLKDTVVLDENTYAPTDDPKAATSLPKELKAHFDKVEARMKAEEAARQKALETQRAEESAAAAALLAPEQEKKG